MLYFGQCDTGISSNFRVFSSIAARMLKGVEFQPRQQELKRTATDDSYVLQKIVFHAACQQEPTQSIYVHSDHILFLKHETILKSVVCYPSALLVLQE